MTSTRSTLRVRWPANFFLRLMIGKGNMRRRGVDKFSASRTFSGLMSFHCFFSSSGSKRTCARPMGPSRSWWPCSCEVKMFEEANCSEHQLESHLCVLRPARHLLPAGGVVLTADLSQAPVELLLAQPSKDLIGMMRSLPQEFANYSVQVICNVV